MCPEATERAGTGCVADIRSLPGWVSLGHSVKQTGKLTNTNAKAGFVIVENWTGLGQYTAAPDEKAIRNRYGVLGGPGRLFWVYIRARYVLKLTELAYP